MKHPQETLLLAQTLSEIHRHIVSRIGFSTTSSADSFETIGFFACKCLEAVDQAAQHYGDESSICAVLADLEPEFPGAGNGYLAALGVSCGWPHPGQEKSFDRIAEVARAIGASFVTGVSRTAFDSIRLMGESQPVDQPCEKTVLGSLLLRGAGWMEELERQNSLPASEIMHELYALLAADDECKSEYAAAAKIFEELGMRGSIAAQDRTLKAVIEQVKPSPKVSVERCHSITSRLSFLMESDSNSLEDFTQALDSLSLNPDYVSTAFGPDFLIKHLALEVDSSGEASKRFVFYSFLDEDDKAQLSKLSKKVKALADFFSQKVPNGDLYFGAIILDKSLGEAMAVRDLYANDLWVHKALRDSIISQYGWYQFCMPVMYLKALLLAATPAQVMAVCDENDMSRIMAYELTGKPEFLINLESERAASGLLEDDLDL